MTTGCHAVTLNQYHWYARTMLPAVRTRPHWRGFFVPRGCVVPDTAEDVREALTWASAANPRSWDYIDRLLDLLCEAGDG